jgi:YHS domain-containing protein
MKEISSERESSCCSTTAGQTSYIDPVCGMGLDGTRPELHTTHAGVDYHFCSSHCLKIFSRNKEDIISGKGLKTGKNRALPIGLVGAAALIILFLTVVFLANSTLGFALSEIRRLWYWVLLLSTGFGLQLGLFVHIRHILRQRLAGATAEVAASGAVSTGSMIACCSHGLVNLLPIFGISAAAAFLARYQLPFIMFGVFSNLVGVTIMVGLAQKNKIQFENPILKAISGLNLRLTRLMLIVTGLIAIGFSIASS